MALHHSSSTIYAPRSILGVVEIRQQILSYTSIINITDWCGLGRNVKDLAIKHLKDLEYFLSMLFSNPEHIIRTFSSGSISLRGPCLDNFTQIWFINTSNTNMYMFIPVQSTTISSFIRIIALLL